MSREYKICRHPESHRGYRRHKPGYCYYTIAAAIWRIRVSIPVLNLAKVVCYHVQQSPMCVHRDSNPNLILGRDKYYPCTMDA